jgi:hypothetical protein
MKFYLTFGCTHPLSNHWIEIEAENFKRARDLALVTFGDKWSMVYEEEEWKRAKESFPDGKIGKTLK